MNIGIAFRTCEGQNIWQNGAGQSILFLARSLASLPFVDRVMLLDAGDQASLPSQALAAGVDIPLLKPHQATEQVDVVFETTAGLDVAWLDRVRARGTKVVVYTAGQTYLNLAEPQVFNKTGLLSRADRCDAVWVLPKDAAQGPMLRVLHRCPVRVAPYLWAPDFLQTRIDELASIGIAFGWRPPHDRGWRLAVLEPNISVAKSCIIPMLACDMAYRASRTLVDQMVVLNSLHLVRHPTMLHLANSLDLVKEHKAVFDGRHDVAGFLAACGDAVVSHQWENDQNHLYLDVLYGGYPLIHNSPWLRGAGYYYAGFDAMGAGAVLLEALQGHEACIDAYRHAAQEVFDRVHPLSPVNLRRHAGLLMSLWNGVLPGGSRR